MAHIESTIRAFAVKALGMRTRTCAGSQLLTSCWPATAIWNEVKVTCEAFPFPIMLRLKILTSMHTCLKASGSQSSSSCGAAMKFVAQSARELLPRSDTTTVSDAWSRPTRYGTAPSACVGKNEKILNVN